MNLVMIPFHDWKKCEHEGFRTRDAHFMQEFEKHPSVEKMLVINRPVSLAEMILMRRNRKPQRGTVIFQENDVSITQVTSKTYILDIFIREVMQPIKMKRHWTPYVFGQEKVYHAVKTALSYLRMNPSYDLFIASPIFVPLVEKLSPKVFAFDALDNFLKHSLYRDTPNLKVYYEYCLNRAQFISTNSQETAAWFLEYRDDIVHISNGVDVEMFNGNSRYSIPEDMLSIPSPIVGYAGKMQEMMDIELMIKTIKSMPDTSFVFIGQQLNPDWVKPLWNYSNVYYLGDKQYQDLPRYYSAFDICIIPYSVAHQHGGDPIKFYEYMAMKKPIVTTDIGNVSAFADYPQVCVSQTHDEFIYGLKTYSDQLKAVSPIVVYPVPDEYFWIAKANIIIEAMMEK